MRVLIFKIIIQYYGENSFNHKNIAFVTDALSDQFNFFFLGIKKIIANNIISKWK